MLRMWLAMPLLLLQGCALSPTYQNRPVIEDKIGQRWNGDTQQGFGTLSITADRKVMVVNFRKNRFCTEPPQDFGQAIKAMAEIVAAYKREKPEGALGTSHNANLTLKNSMETTLKEVAKQPYGIMFLRYQSAFLCQMFANEALSQDEYRDFADRTMDRAYEILDREVDLALARAKSELTNKQKAFKKSDSIVFSKPRIVAKSDQYIDTTVTLPAELVKGFYKMSLGFRKSKSHKAYAYKAVNHANGIVLAGNTIKFKSSVVSPDSGSYSSGDVLEAGIKIISILGNEPQFKYVPDTVVFYKLGDEKIKLDDKKRVWDGFKSNEELVFQLPKHVKQGYKDFHQMRMLSVQVQIDGINKSFEATTEVISKSDTEWKVKLIMDKDNQKIYKTLHKKHNINLSFKASQIKSLDVPKIDGNIIISKK